MALNGLLDIDLAVKNPEELCEFWERHGLNSPTAGVLGTETLAAERLQAEQLIFQQALVDTIPYPVFYKDADARFLGFNRAYEETFAVRRADLVGKRVIELDYLPEADRLAYQAEDEAVIAGASSIKRDVQLPFADGQLHDTLYFVSGFRRPDGSPGGLVGTFIDITALKEAERDMARMTDLERFNRLALGREQRVLELKGEVNRMAEALGQAAPYESAAMVELQAEVEDYVNEFGSESAVIIAQQSFSLSDLVNLDELQVLLTNFCDSVGIASAIINLEGKVLVAARWQRACTDFHRAKAGSCSRCIESDTELALQLTDGQAFTLYQCKNGMTDAAAPIVVEGRHLANVFIGQFHSAPPDMAFFRDQARQFGYDEAAYLAAVAEAPVIESARLPAILSFLSGFARMISTMSLARQRADQAQQALLQQAQLLRRERVAALSLAEDADAARHPTNGVNPESQA
jgi:PAS domain S-box-containing protein